MMAVFTQILKEKDKYPEAYQTITHASLVDDMADSRPTTQHMRALIQQLSEFFPEHCSMDIRKFVVNNEELMLDILPDDRIAALKLDSDVKNIFNKVIPQPSLKILGIHWNYVDDEMFFDFCDIFFALGPVDKLKMLSILHSLYDPLGVLIPFTIVVKLIMQLCWKIGLTWKSKLTSEILNVWQPWVDQINEIKGYAFKRTIMPGETPEKYHHQIHVFADASEDMYVAVAYMRGEGAGETTVRFIQARSRIKPVKSTATIPRMELLAIALALTLLKRLAKAFDIQNYDLVIWTDSRSCHDWMRKETRSLQVFIKNRVLKILQYLKLKQVCWVPGHLNPADAGTRGLTVQQLKDHVLSG
jgi:ribonuclease HI